MGPAPARTVRCAVKRRGLGISLQQLVVRHPGRFLLVELALLLLGLDLAARRADLLRLLAVLGESLARRLRRGVWARVTIDRLRCLSLSTF